MGFSKDDRSAASPWVLDASGVDSGRLQQWCRGAQPRQAAARSEHLVDVGMRAIDRRPAAWLLSVTMRFTRVKQSNPSVPGS